MIGSEVQRCSCNRKRRGSIGKSTIECKGAIGHCKQAGPCCAAKSRAATHRDGSRSEISGHRTSIEEVAVRRGKRTNPGIVGHYSGAHQERAHTFIATNGQLATGNSQGTGSKGVIGRGGQIAIGHQRPAQIGVALGECECA